MHLKRTPADLRLHQNDSAIRSKDSNNLSHNNEICKVSKK